MLLSALPVSAQNRTKNLSHFLAVSIGGGEANNLFYQKGITPQIGGAGNLMVAYELHANKFIFGVGVEAQYQYTREKTDTYLDEFGWVDKVGEAVQYGYVYNNLSGHEHDIRMTLPVYFGYVARNGFYALVGGKVSLSVWSKAHTEADMFTQGTYAWSIEPVRSVGINDFSSLGYYPEQTYATDASYTERLWVAASLELGSYIPLPSKYKKVRMRAGVYADYALRLDKMPANPQADYSAVDVNPYTQSQADLQQHLVLNPVLNSDRLGDKCHNLEVGVRLTVLFDVSTYNPPCHCVR